jgi:ribonuclease Z
MTHPTTLPDTLVTLTGTGVPHPSPGRAGAGTLVRYGEISLQFDAGRGTVLRLQELGLGPYQLTTQFLTHVHSDHLVDLPDLAMTRWIQQQLHATGPLTVVAPEGATATFARNMFDVYADDIATRMEHVQGEPPSVDLQTFQSQFSPIEVWTSPDGQVVVEAVGVHHEPVEDAVAYRVTTPTGVVVISGDTTVCDEVESFSAGCDVLVHEACRTTALAEVIKGTLAETIFSYHADTVPLGGLAERAGVGHLLLTHLIPPPNSEAESAAFAEDVRQGGFTGDLTVGSDLDTITINNPVRSVAG